MHARELGLRRDSAFERVPQVALVSMPWTSAWMPSIQLAILRQCLAGTATCDTYELYLDYAALISGRLYSRLSEAGGIIEEWVFAKQFFEGEGYTMREGFLDEFPAFGIGSRDVERRTLVALSEVTNDYLERMSTEVDWSRYDVVGFTLSIYQTTASLALSRLIRQRHPDVKIVFGGNSCVGPAAPALLRISPYVDVVVRGEAEPVFASLVRRLANRQRIDDIGGIVFRSEDGTIRETPPNDLHQPQRAVSMPDFDAYFERFRTLDLCWPEHIWIPFESSRGCWWGEKSQCTFCGLHEIMQYRARRADDVLEELDFLYERYGVPRFFATDLIMPQEYYRDLLPKLHGRGYEFFYELKANATRQMLGSLAKAGIKNVQPGLESLSSSVLKIMKKGQSGTHVVQFLKWAAEYGLDVEWNLLTGTPTEDPAENERAAANAPSLYHFQPPRVIQFELDRYSPIYDAPEEYGVTDVRPLYVYDYLYPVEPELRAALAYRFEYDDAMFVGRPPWLGGGRRWGEVPEVIDGRRSALGAGACPRRRTQVTFTVRRIDDYQGLSCVGRAAVLQTGPSGSALVRITRFPQSPCEGRQPLCGGVSRRLWTV